MTAFSRLRPLVPAVLGAMLVAVTACGGSEEDSDTSTTSDDGTSSDGGTLDEPVTIEHDFGSTEIESVPERVVSVDIQWTDVMLAMGVGPVGYTTDTYAPEPDLPWQELPADAELLPTADGLPIEQIAALQPDLIVGTFSIPDEETYQLLSEIAPTVAKFGEQQVTPWQDLVRAAGDILADQDGAEELIESVNSQVTAASEELPGLEGRTFSLGQYVVGDSMYIVADEADGSSVFFQQLGMVMYAPVKEQGDETGDARINVSTERADLLGADLLTFLVNGGDESDLADIPGFDQLPGTVAVLGYSTILGLNTPSPLSIPYVLEQLRPFLEQAADGAA